MASALMVLTTVSAAAACQDLTGGAPVARNDLPTTSPQEAGLSGPSLEAFRSALRAGAYPGVHSVLVVRDGRIAFEEYLAGWNADRLHEVQSISKGVVSLAVGVALEQGALESIEQRVVEFFPELTIQNLDDRKRRITIADILRMSTGTDYTEGSPNSPHWQLNRLSRGWTQFWLDRPMVGDPGTGWSYDSGGVIALSSIFQRTTGVHVDEYARRHIFEPLGIGAFRWERNAEGQPHAGGGLHLRPRDLAKIGVMILNGGRWNGVQVVPADWVDVSTAVKARFGGASPFLGYAYLWWVFEPDPAVPSGSPITAGTGLGGQYLFMIPDHDMVVVVTGWSNDDEESRAAIGFLYEELLVSAR